MIACFYYMYYKNIYNNVAINNDDNIAILIPFSPFNTEVWNSWFKKSSYEIELCKMMPHFESLTHKFLQKSFFRVTNWKVKLLFFHFQFGNSMLKRKVSLRVTNSKIKNKTFYFTLLTWGWKIKSCSSSY